MLAFGFVFELKPSAQSRLDTQDVEETGGDALAAQIFRLNAGFTKHKRDAGDRRDRFEYFLPRRPVHVVLRRRARDGLRVAVRAQRLGRRRRSSLPKRDQSIVLVEGQRPEDDSIDDREDRRARTDAERQDEQRYNGEGFRGTERTESGPDVIAHDAL